MRGFACGALRFLGCVLLLLLLLLLLLTRPCRLCVRLFLSLLARVSYLRPPPTVDEIVKSPNQTQSDSFYFVQGKLIMHNKARYTYFYPPGREAKLEGKLGGGSGEFFLVFFLVFFCLIYIAAGRPAGRPRRAFFAASLHAVCVCRFHSLAGRELRRFVCIRTRARTQFAGALSRRGVLSVAGGLLVFSRRCLVRACVQAPSPQVRRSRAR